jgi:sporulation protein YlmC with PRC-barrel domain
VSKTTMPAIIAAMLAVSMPVAFAQTTTGPASRSAATTASTAGQMKPDEIRASKFIGSTVYDVQNQNIGSVKELIFDRNGRIDVVVIDVGAFLGMGGKNVAVKLNEIKTANNRLTLDMSKEQLKSAGEFKFPETSSTGTSTAPVNEPATRPANPPASR